MDERFHKRRGDYEGYYDSYNYGGYNCRRSSQTLETTSRPLSYNSLKLPLLCRTFGSCDYEEWEQKVKSLRRMGAQQIKTWSLIKQAFRPNFELKTMKDKDKVKQRKNSWNLQWVKILQK
ncbi:hypothetical protein M9H77_13054 [Catharanthus roseus]|uniref:Uncharacterized protein n=1 Tax=Catharanthus roseus TaxID=4058 RepID=A0ACC0BJ82_CATRO|nr:hypothetical protein M9H77_13054 [Catharanthus roseus]